MCQRAVDQETPLPPKNIRQVTKMWKMENLSLDFKQKDKYLRIICDQQEISPIQTFVLHFPLLCFT
jgi:hypothetical protein